MRRAPRTLTTIAFCTLPVATLGGCETEDPLGVIEETNLDRITATASAARGPRLIISETFYSTGRVTLNTGLSSFALPKKTQVYEGFGTISWSQPGEDGSPETHSSATALAMTMEYTVDGSPEDLSCYDPDAPDNWDEVICIAISGTMFNPFPNRRPEIEITAKSTDPIRTGQDPASFTGRDVVLRTRRPQGLAAYRQPAIYALPVALDYVGTGNPQFDRWRVRAAIDRGSVTIQQVGLYYSSVSTLDPSDFALAGFATIDPYTGLVEKCVLGTNLGGSPNSTFTGTLRYFWHVAFSLSGAPDEVQGGLVEVPLGPELIEPVPPAVFSPGCQ